MAAKTILIQTGQTASAVEQFKTELGNFSPALILYFASSIYKGIEIELENAFPGIPSIGSTSHSEYCGSHFVEDSIVFLVLDQDTIADVDIHVVEGISAYPDFQDTIAEIHAHFGGYDVIKNNFEKYAGIVLFEASARAEEHCMEQLNKATELLYVGGTSSEKDGYSRIYANGRSYVDAAILATFQTVSGCKYLKTQSAHRINDKTYTVTKCDMRTRTMYELDNRPVSEVYAEALGVPPTEIIDHFVSNPLGILINGEVYVRTFNNIQEDGSITLHCGIPEGTELFIMESGDIIEDTRRDLEKTITEPAAAVINFNCYYRTFEVLDKGLLHEYCSLLGQYPSMGFSTAGEAFIGHINETSTILILNA